MATAIIKILFTRVTQTQLEILLISFDINFDG